MKTVNDLPTLILPDSLDGMEGLAREWMKEMVEGGMEFHLDDDPSDIQDASTGELLFTPGAAAVVKAYVEVIRDKLGNDRMWELYAEVRDAGPIEDRIFLAVFEAMQSAEEVGGPEAAEYVDLMTRIIHECNNRIRAHSLGTQAKLG